MLRRRFLLHPCLRASVIAFAVLLTLVGRPLRATVSETLTTLDIEDAIRFGQSGDPSPYPIYNPGELRPGTPRGLVMALVYTPFIRVALAAKVALAARRDFRLEDVTDDLTQPVAYVAYRWYCCVDHKHGEDKTTWDPHREPLDYRVATDSDPQLKALRLILLPIPLSVNRDLSWLMQLGDRLPYDDLVVVAAYPVRELARARDFAIYQRQSQDGQVGISTILGRVTPADLAGWR